ncbi:BAR adaptor protein Hob3 [Blastocladiella emersonii ATCC 22665]|nr:BAR adaptor protein Hob3 [Blastocladiella emersonii ATCC 22665]
MSWKGFTKAVNRAGTSILQTAGAIEKTIDREFEEEERRFKSLEAKVDRLHKEAKGYLDALRAMSLSQSRMATTVENFYDETAPLQLSATQYRQLVELLEDEIRSQIDSEYRTAVIDPLSRFCEYFPDYNEAIRKRNNKLLDYDAVRSKHRKLVEKPADDPTRLPKAEEEVAEAKRVFEALNRPLKDELPELIALRTSYLEPTFEALVKLQNAYCHEAVARLTTLQPHLAAAGVQNVHDPDLADRHLEGVVENALAGMRELSIVSGIAL